MRPAPFPSARPTTRSNANIAWSVILLLALLILWFVWSLPSLRAGEAARPVNAQSLSQELVPLDGIAQVAAGGSHTCALTTEGGVKCWGSNSSGQLGDGTTTSKTIPVDVEGLGSSVVAITAGDAHTCALTTAGGVKCWGSNYYGQLQLGDDPYSRTTPVDVLVPLLNKHLFLPAVQR